MEVNMLRKVSTLSIAGALIAGVLFSTPAHAAISNGSTCTVVNKTIKVSGFSYKCVTAVKSTVILDKTRTTIFLPTAATNKNARKYYLAVDCISQVSSHAKSIKDMSVITQSTVSAIKEIDSEITVQQKANESAPATIAGLLKANEDTTAQITAQNETVVTLQKNVEDLKVQVTTIVSKLPELQKNYDALTVALNAVLADKKNTTAARDEAVKKYRDAIAVTKKAMDNIPLVKLDLERKIRDLNGDVTNIRSQLLGLRQSITENNGKVKQLKEIETTITRLTKSKEDVVARESQAKLDLVQSLNSRNLLCSQGL
jgi:chromosome segregation ATPase